MQLLHNGLQMFKKPAAIFCSNILYPYWATELANSNISGISKCPTPYLLNLIAIIISLSNNFLWCSYYKESTRFMVAILPILLSKSNYFQRWNTIMRQ